MALHDTSSAGVDYLIGSSVLTASQASFDTNTILGGNIPGSYNHLRFLLVGRSDATATAVTPGFTFNNDGGTNYDYEWRVNKGTSPSDVNANAATSFQVGGIGAASATSGSPGSMQVTIPCYAATTFRKQMLFTCWYKNVADGTAGAYSAGVGGGEWRSTAAITRIIVTPSSGNFIAGSAFYLYGVV